MKSKIDKTKSTVCELDNKEVSKTLKYLSSAIIE